MRLTADRRMMLLCIRLELLASLELEQITNWRNTWSIMRMCCPNHTIPETTYDIRSNLNLSYPARLLGTQYRPGTGAHGEESCLLI